MSDISPSASSANQTTIALHILPIEDEADDLDTLALAGQLCSFTQQALIQSANYAIQSPPENRTRVSDLVLLITLLGTAIVTYKDLLTSIFQMINTIIEVQAKRGRIEEIEAIIAGKTFILRDVSKKTAQELIATIEKHFSDTTPQLPSGTPPRIHAKVSKQSKGKNDQP